jgi:hypothetical protein
MAISRDCVRLPRLEGGFDARDLRVGELEFPGRNRERGIPHQALLADDHFSLHLDGLLLIGTEREPVLDGPDRADGAHVCPLRAQERWVWSSISFISFVPLWVGVEQNVACRHSGGILDLDHARPAGRIAGAHQFGETVAVAGAAGEDQFAVGGEFQEGAVGKVGAGPWILRGEVVSSGAAMTVGPAARPEAMCGVCEAQVRA